MNKYQHPVTRAVMEMHQRISAHLRQNLEWKADVDKAKGERAFQTFFESPEECLGGTFRVQPLHESDIQAMYPDFLKTIQSLPPNSYAYVFNCNSAVFDPAPQALTALKIIKL
jgi:hypothetical protein